MLSRLYRLPRLLMNIRHWFSKEFEIDEKYRPIATAIMLMFSLGYSFAFLGLMQYVAYLGPGLGDTLNFSPYLQVFDHIDQYSQTHMLGLPIIAFVALTVLNLIFSVSIIFIGYWIYPKTMGKPFPITILFTYLALNGVCTVGIFSIQLVGGLLAPMFGYDVLTGIQAFTELLLFLKAWAEQVPTLVDMPAWLAFFILQMCGGFFHYWFHRLAHESRLLWLLFHRTHHMTPELIQPTAQAVFNAFPFFLFAAVPYVVIFSVIGQLVTSESLLVYLIVYKLISAFANLFSHQTALYEWAQNKWYIRALSTVTSEGVYHYLHHSAETQHNVDRGNLINIGGGLFFFWDRVFGTYYPVSSYKPRVGLQGIEAEAMSSNPLRLAFAGIAQMVYELRYSGSIKEMLLIIFGSSSYVPPRSKDYVLRSNAAH